MVYRWNEEYSLSIGSVCSFLSPRYKGVMVKNIFSYLQKSLKKTKNQFFTEYTLFGFHFKKKNWSLHSGERQTAKEIQEIRKDHLNRYQFVIDYLTGKRLPTSNILDCFCGNGYGSWMLSRAFPSKRVLGIDGSGEAIVHAQKFFATPSTTFEHRLFPFKLKSSFDVIVSLESIEHIENDSALLKMFFDHLSTNGLLFLSMPNQDKYPLEKTGNHFHYRHYTLDEAISLFNKIGFKILEHHSQDVYILSDDMVPIGLIEEEKMHLQKDFSGQFDIFILKKISTI